MVDFDANLLFLLDLDQTFNNEFLEIGSKLSVRIVSLGGDYKGAIGDKIAHMVDLEQEIQNVLTYILLALLAFWLRF